MRIQIKRTSKLSHNGHVVEATIERTGFMSWQGTVFHERPDGMSSVDSARGRSMRVVRNKLGLTPGWAERMTGFTGFDDNSTRTRSIGLSNDPALDWPDTYPDGGR